MYKTILVPLDGSELAVGILPHVREIVRNTDARVILLRVTPEAINPYPAVGVSTYSRVDTTKHIPQESEWHARVLSDPIHRAEWIENEVEEAQAYLDTVAANLAQVDLHVRTMTRSGAAAEAILDVANREHVDLIAMSTHGRTGIGRLLLGSIADQVVHHAKVPVFLLRAKRRVGEADAEIWTKTTYKRILVPLDGSQMASTVLPHVQALARLTGAEVLLLQVVHAEQGRPYAGLIFYTGGPSISSNISKSDGAEGHTSSDTYRDRQTAYALETAQNKLDAAAAGLRAAGLRVETMIQVGDTAETILDVANSCDADVIAMATHGRSGVPRILLGSIAERVLHHAEKPLLLVRASDHTVGDAV
jgi:nucleotide-binding universal stress UspA family protein